MIAGIPNLKIAGLLANLPTKISLNKLFKRCTIPVNPIARSTGKNSANTGRRIVPNPKPEKKVRSEAKNAVMQISNISIC
jgi:hypothetical protein